MQVEVAISTIRPVTPDTDRGPLRTVHEGSVSIEAEQQQRRLLLQQRKSNDYPGYISLVDGIEDISSDAGSFSMPKQSKSVNRFHVDRTQERPRLESVPAPRRKVQNPTTVEDEEELQTEEYQSGWNLERERTLEKTITSQSLDEEEDGGPLSAPQRVRSRQRPLRQNYSLHLRSLSNQSFTAGRLDMVRPNQTSSSAELFSELRPGLEDAQPLEELSAEEIQDIQGDLLLVNSNQTVHKKVHEGLEAVTGPNGLPTTALLTLAVWWNLKAQRCHALLTENPTKKAVRDRFTWPSNTSIFQAYVDLLKSRAILQHLGAEAAAGRKRFSEPELKIVSDLRSSIQFDLNIQQEVAMTWPEELLVSQDFAFRERCRQSVEKESAMPAGLDEPHLIQPASRWVTVHEADAGLGNGEKILYRTFVNAQVGKNDVRRKSSTAPYMLVAWAPAASRSEIRISLINSTGTLNLSKSMSHEDFACFTSQSKKMETFFAFPRQDADICFLTEDDFDSFLNIPRKFFAETKERSPGPGEFLMFRGAVEKIDDSVAAIMRNLKPEHGGIPSHAREQGSCELSLFGDISNICWKLTRRLVLSSPPDAREPWCCSFWLPLGGIFCQVSGKDLAMQWYDWTDRPRHDKRKHQPAWVISDDPSPNRSLNLRFAGDGEEAAQEMSQLLLCPFETSFYIPQFNFQGNISGTKEQEIRVYHLQDLDNSESYSAITTINRHADSKDFSSVYILPKEFDMDFDRHAEVLRFEKLPTPHYVVETLRSTEDDVPVPTLKDVELGWRAANFHFEHERQKRQFLKDLVGWDVQWCCDAKSVVFGRLFKEKIKDVVCCLWTRQHENDSETCLTIQGQGPERSSRWYTMRIANQHDLMLDFKAGQKLVVANAELLQGPRLNGRSLQAADYKGDLPYRKLREPKVTVIFRSNTDISELHERLREMPLPNHRGTVMAKPFARSVGSHDSGRPYAEEIEHAVDVKRYTAPKPWNVSGMVSANVYNKRSPAWDVGAGFDAKFRNG